MALQVKQGTFDLNTATGNQSVTGVGFKPDLVLFLGSLAGNSLPVYSGDARQAIGAMARDGTQASWTNASEDNVGTSDSSRDTKSGYCIDFVVWSEGTTVAASFVSMDADGFTINLGTAAGSAHTMGYLAIEGLQHVTIGTFADGTSTGTLDITGLGFQPDALITYGGMQQSVGVGSTMAHCYGTFGFTDGVNQFCTGVWDEDNQATSDCACWSSSNHIYAAFSSGATTAEFAFSQWLSDGFQIDRQVNFGTTRYWAYVALGGVNAYVDVTTTPASTGDQARTGYGFQPEALIGALTLDTTLEDDPPLSSYSMCVGISDGTDDFAAHLVGQNGQATTNTARAASDADFFYNTDGDASGLVMEAIVKSFDTDGVTLTWQTNTWGSGRYFGLLGLKANPRPRKCGFAAA